MTAPEHAHVTTFTVRLGLTWMASIIPGLLQLQPEDQPHLFGFLDRSRRRLPVNDEAVDARNGDRICALLARYRVGHPEPLVERRRRPRHGRVCSRGRRGMPHVAFATTLSAVDAVLALKVAVSDLYKNRLGDRMRGPPADRAGLRRPGRRDRLRIDLQLPPHDTPPRTFSDILKVDEPLFLAYRNEMVRRGVLEMPLPLMWAQVAYSHTDADVDRALETSRGARRLAWANRTRATSEREPLMRWTDMYVAGTGASFPDRVSVESAIADGRCDPEEARQAEYLEIAVAADDQGAPDFAVAAARQALDRSGFAAHDVGNLLHAVVLHSGLDGWNSASYVQRQVLAAGCVVGEMRGGCGGAFVGLELACGFLHAHPEIPAAMVTAADCWPQPVVDRWRSGGGVIFGDGGAAVVVSRRGGFARLLSLTTHTDPSLEQLHRGDASLLPFSPQARSGSNSDLFRRVVEFFRSVMPVDEFLQRRSNLARAAIEQAVEEAGVSLAEVEHLVLPFDGAMTSRRDYIEPFHLKVERTTWEFDRRTGHFGAGDPLASLNHLVESRRLRANDRVLLVSEGAGWTLTAAVIEVIEEPTP
jgi:3-oxoacyl-[acyl-carrier-protein] synthase III